MAEKIFGSILIRFLCDHMLFPLVKEMINAPFIVITDGETDAAAISEDKGIMLNSVSKRLVYWRC